MKLADGSFRVSVCAHGHVTIEALDAESGAVRFVSVMSKREALDLAGALLNAGSAGNRPVSSKRRSH